MTHPHANHTHTAPRRRQIFLIVSLLMLIMVVSFSSLLLGSPQFSPRAVWTIFLGRGLPFDRLIILQLRLPRLMLGVLAGAALGTAGVYLQDTMQNDLAGPELLGVTAGATIVMAVITIFALPLSFFLYPVFALLGSLFSSGIVIFSARRIKNSLELVLIGAAVSAFLDAVMIGMISIGSQTQVTFLYRFLLGSLAARTWQYVIILLPWVGIGIPIAFLFSKTLHILQLGDSHAKGLGIHVAVVRTGFVVLSAVLVAPVVAVCGPIAYVSLLSPHVARRLTGTTNAKTILPISLLFGVFLLLTADLCARLVFLPQELPVGAFTTIIGGLPLLLLLQKKHISRQASSGGRLLYLGIHHYHTVILLSCLSLCIVGLLHLGIGEVFLSPGEIIAAFTGHAIDTYHAIILFDLRVPRTLIAITVGAMLGIAGAMLQSVLRNPLAEPTITGVSAGGVLFAALWIIIVSQGIDREYILPFMTLIGSLVVGGIIYWIQWRGCSDPLRLILSGVIASAICTSLTSLLLVLHEKSLGSILIWVIGSLDARAWGQWQILWPWALVTLPLGFLSASITNTLSLGDTMAKGLGVSVEISRGIVLILAVCLTAGAVAVVGAVGFISLVGPHIARRLVGNDARRLYLLSAILTAVLLVGSDTIAQLLGFVSVLHGQTYTAIPVGAVTAFIGAPFFLFLLRKNIYHV